MSTEVTLIDVWPVHDPEFAEIGRKVRETKVVWHNGREYLVTTGLQDVKRIDRSDFAKWCADNDYRKARLDVDIIRRR